MTAPQRVAALAALGEALANLNGQALDGLLDGAWRHNNWFTPENTRKALAGTVRYLNRQALEAWTARYPLDRSGGRRVGVVMAGNIPLAGIHDYLCVLLAGHALMAKTSSQDSFLIGEINKILAGISPGLAARVSFPENLKGMDAVIATGSDNSARYFAHYFGKYPHIIRKNRTGVAVLNGTESPEHFAALADDVFTYYGLGCRNVSKIFVPEGHVPDPLLEALTAPAQAALGNHRYHNNYDYNKAIYLVNSVPHLDNGGLILTESDELVSPVSVLFKSRYSSPGDLEAKLLPLAGKIQCVVSAGGWYPGSLPFGTAQTPGPDDYADGIDTLAFLCGL